MRYIKECLKKKFRNFSMTSVGESAGLMKCGFFFWPPRFLMFGSSETEKLDKFLKST